MLVHLEARGFRNLERLSWSVGRGSHLILGANGAGKTSVLEAIYGLATTRSFRTPRISDCVHHGDNSFSIQGEIEDLRRTQLEVKWAEGKRSRSVNGHRGSLAEHLAVLSLASWTALDIEILTGPPTARRRFMDRGVLGLRPASLGSISTYRKALLEKRKLLQQGGRELEVWNQVIAVPAAEILRRRAGYVNRLRSRLVEVLQECDLGLGVIELSYLPSPRQGLDGSSRIFEELMAISPREIALGQPMLGPHRDELRIRWDGHDLRRVASAGERKALGIALLVAHGRVLAEIDRPPLFLVDDADTELDQTRLERLWRALGSQSQVFVTSNRPDVWRDLEITHRWFCKSGQLHPEAAL